MHPVQIASYFDILSQSQKAYGRQLEPVCRQWNLTRSEVDVLLFLYNNPQYDRAADIVTRRGIAKSHVSLSVTNLAERQLLERQESPSDRRTVHLKLTEDGRSIAAEARKAQEQFFRMLYDGVSAEELEIWDKITQKVFDNISTMNK